MHHNIGNVTVYKDLTGFGAGNFISRNATVGTTDPEIFGTLTKRKALEIIGVLLKLFSCPFFVPMQESLIAPVDLIFFHVDKEFPQI
jgi:hypothetical protein